MNEVKCQRHGFDAAYEAEMRNVEALTGLMRFRTRGLKAVAPDALMLETPKGLPGVVVEVTPYEGEPWAGDFDPGPEGLTHLCATPSSTVVCVIARGQGYWVPVDHPKGYETIRSIPIRHVVPVVASGLLVFGDYDRLTCYTATGLLWRSERLSWDGLKRIEVGPDAVHGLAWDSPANRQVEFSVSLRDGSATGGASPE